MKQIRVHYAPTCNLYNGVIDLDDYADYAEWILHVLVFTDDMKKKYNFTVEEYFALAKTDTMLHMMEKVIDFAYSQKVESVAEYYATDVWPNEIKEVYMQENKLATFPVEVKLVEFKFDKDKFIVEYTFTYPDKFHKAKVNAFIKRFKTLFHKNWFEEISVNQFLEPNENTIAKAYQTCYDTDELIRQANKELLSRAHKILWKIKKGSRLSKGATPNNKNNNKEDK